MSPITHSGRANKWVSYDQDIETLEEFLAMWKPSGPYAREVQWLCVSKETRQEDNDAMGKGLLEAWEALCVERGGNVDCRHIQQLAQDHKVLSGKWLIYVKSKEVDAAWSKIASPVVGGLLGKDAKVSTGHLPEGTLPDDGKVSKVKSVKVDVKLAEAQGVAVGKKRARVLNRKGREPN